MVALLSWISRLTSSPPKYHDRDLVFSSLKVCNSLLSQKVTIWKNLQTAKKKATAENNPVYTSFIYTIFFSTYINSHLIIWYKYIPFVVNVYCILLVYITWVLGTCTVLKCIKLTLTCHHFSSKSTHFHKQYYSRNVYFFFANSITVQCSGKRTNTPIHVQHSVLLY